MSDVEYTIKEYAVDHYGDLVVPTKPTFDNKTKIWKAQLRSTYPRIIEDEKSGEVLVGFLDLKDLGIIKLNDKLQVIDATTSKECDEQLFNKLDLWKKETERIVITASSDVFAKFEESIHVLNPLELILDQLLSTTKDGDIKIADAEIEQENNPDRILEYLDLLLELKIVRRVQGGYIHGNTYAELLAKIKDSQKLKTVLISYIIKQRYPVLRQVFGITQLEPFVHLVNTYYSASLEVGKLIHMSFQHLHQRYQTLYKKMTKWDFESKLNELVEKGALEYENHYVIGKNEYFNDMLQLREKVQLNPMI